MLFLVKKSVSNFKKLIMPFDPPTPKTFGQHITFAKAMFLWPFLGKCFFDPATNTHTSAFISYDPPYIEGTKVLIFYIEFFEDSYLKIYFFEWKDHVIIWREYFQISITSDVFTNPNRFIKSELTQWKSFMSC
jgi:hypothetical protein